MPRFRLRTFATLALIGPGDDPTLGKQGQQRRRLALLAVLAASGDRGRSRDQLLLLFWPDSSQDRARHSLEQLLYAIRSSMDEGVFAGVNPVRLNPDVIASDVGEFMGALARGDREAAVELYQGSFLDGFYLPDAPEFEQWLVTERASLASSYATALEQLAQAAVSASDSAAAIRWWTRLTEADPVSGKYATGLMRALADNGDHSAALQFAERHEAVVKRELGTGIGASVAAMRAEVRAEAERGTGEIRHAPAPTARPTHAPAAATDATRIEPITPRIPLHRRARPLFVVAALLLVIATLGAAWFASNTGDSGAGAKEAPSIAVLPFKNVSRQPGDAPLVDGLSEDLIAVLARITNLRVIGRTSALAFTNSDAGAQRIADSLGVSHLLEGSWQRIGSQLRVQVRLVDARDGSTRWSETYNREMRDIFSVQSEIAASVARELDLRLGSSTRAGISRGPTQHVAAYELYLRANDPALTRSDSASAVALEYFRQAIALDPEYAAAYAGIARIQLRLSRQSGDSLARIRGIAIAEEAALKAVALDDSSGDAHAALGLVRKNKFEFASAEAELKRAVALEPNSARFREWLVQLYIIRERAAEALSEAHRAMALDPLSSTARAEAANALLALDRCDEALVLLENLKSLRPPLLRAGTTAALCYTRKKMWPEAIAEAQRMSAVTGPSGRALVGYALARAGQIREAEEILTEMRERAAKVKGGAFQVAVVYAGLGRRSEAIAWLEKSVDDRSIFLEHMSGITHDLRGDPAYQGFRQRLGL